MSVFDGESVENRPSFAYRTSDVSHELKEMRDNGVKRGAWLGFDHLDKHWSLKRGSTTYLQAAPHAGKSSFVNELICNLVKFSGYKIVIWSVETGSVRDNYNELLWAYMRMPYMKNNKGVFADDSEVAKAMAVFEQSIRVLDFGRRDVSTDMIYDEVERLRDMDDFDADVLIVDPYTEIVDDDNMGLRADVALGRKLSKIARNSSTMDVHTIIAVHTNNIPPMLGEFSDGSKRNYIPAPLPTQIAGGQAFFRRAYMLISLWVPPVGLRLRTEVDPDTGEEKVIYAEKWQTIVTILKAKPKIVGSLGSIDLFFDPLQNRYKDREGRISYQCPNGFDERETSPNLDMGLIAKQNELPY